MYMLTSIIVIKDFLMQQHMLQGLFQYFFQTIIYSILLFLINQLNNHIH